MQRIIFYARHYARLYASGIIMLLLCFLHIAISLEAAATVEPVEIPLIDNPPSLDGKLDDPVWEKAIHFQDFISFKPDFGKLSSENTVVYACTDRENFYFAARCSQKNPSHIKGAVTKRDNIFGDDWLAINIDTFNDQQTAYAFLINPLGIQGDGIINTEGNLDESHDMIWYSQGIIDEKGYTLEVKIPFKSIRFPIEPRVKMRLWLVRNIVRTSENVCFPPISPGRGSLLTQTQPILVKDMKYKRVIEILPAFTHARSGFHEKGQWAPLQKNTDFSLTAKLGITPGLVMDATYNPDFSQVEADAGQVDVNRRYALFYQEKRPFFLEGIDAFQFAGNTEDAPLYAVVHTRTIFDPLLGLKFSGKIGNKNNIAAIFVWDDSPDPDGGETKLNRAFFGILRYKRIFTGDSYLGGFYTSKDLSNHGGYNRVAGIDGRLRLSKYAAAEYHLLGSLTNDRDDPKNTSGHALGLRYNYESRNVKLDLGLQDVSRNFRVDSGFLNRQGVTRLGIFGMYRLYPKSSFFQRLEPFYWSYHLLDKESNRVESFNMFTFLFNLPRSSSFRLDLILANEVYCGKSFNTSGIGFQSQSQITAHLFFYLFFRHTQGIFYQENPFAGKTNQMRFNLEYQPTEKVNTSFDVTFSDFRRSSDSRKEYEYTIFRNRTTFQVNKYLFFRGIVEYNTYWKRMFLDLLASFTYIPGTVVHVGYGSLQEKIGWNGAEYIPASRFQEIQRAFFFKISYLWRL